MSIRSPFFYVGDKYKLMPQLNNYFPSKIERLIEPFCGGGSVFLNTEADSYLANDLNTYMIKLHLFFKSFKGDTADFLVQFENVIKSYGFSASYLGIDVPASLKEKYKKTYYAQYNKTSYCKLKKHFNENKTDLMSLYVLLIYGFNHMLRFNKVGEFNLPVGNVDYNKNVNKAIHKYFQFVSSKDIKFENKDYKVFLNSLEYKKNDFIYLDPPYLISACEYNKGWTSEDEIELLNILDNLNERKVKFALSNVLVHKDKRNDLLEKWSKKYFIYPVKSNYISYHDNSIKNTVEVLITNYKVRGVEVYGKKERI